MRLLLKSRLLWLVVGLASAVGVYFAARTTTIMTLAHAQSIAVPFLAEMEITFPDGQGGSTVGRRRTLARRADGTTSFISTAGALSWGETSRKMTFMDGRSISMIDSMKIKSTWPNRPAKEIAYRKMLFAAQDQVCIPQGTTERLLRYDVLGGEKVAVTSIESHGKRKTLWKAARLGCELLSYVVERSNPDGTYQLSAEGRMTRLVIGEPDARYFTDGSDYIETLPSRAQSLFLSKMGLAEDEELLEMGRQLDTTYPASERLK